MKNENRTYIGVLQIRIKIESAFSLKDKRQVVRSVLERVEHRLRFSASEVGDMDMINLSSLAFVCVSNSNKHLEERLDKLEHFLEDDFRFEIIESNSEILNYY